MAQPDFILSLDGVPHDDLRVGRIEQIDCTTQLSRYRLVLGPQLLRLKLRRNCRVFQERSVPQILATLLEEHGIQADTCRFRLGADYPARAYHSDIGGGYPPLMTEKLLIGKPRPVLLYWGRSPEQSAAWRDAVAEAEQLELQGVPAGSLHIVTRPLSPSRQRSTASSERHLVLLEVERQVRGELARVYLWAMHRLASAAEVPLPSLDTTDPRLAIPADLKPIAEKLLAAVQDGVPPALSFEEERYLRACDIHLSAHWAPLQGLLVNKPAPHGRLVYRNQPQKDYPA